MGKMQRAAGILLALSFIPMPVPAEEPKPARDAKPSVLTVGNEAGKLTPCPAAEWARLPRHKVQVKERDGGAATYEGVSLVDLLRFGGTPFGEHLKGKRVAAFVLVEAADGYRATLALAEVDPSVTDNMIVLADSRDGKPLPAEAGPYRLVVPHDKIHSRWVRQVTRITVQIPAVAKGEGEPKK
jgi:DMSO/TMAO reductase YedYZ molybdopterin-dependent catalytic subunit